jgi:hypothetical protein
MSRGRWWLAGWLWLVVAAGTVLVGWRAGVALGLPAYLVCLGIARATLADRPAAPPRAPEDRRPATWTPMDRVGSALSWGADSGRLFDRATRPLLQRALGAVLAERGLDLDRDRDRDRVRQLLGERAWYLLDPARPPRAETLGGGVDRATLEHLVGRLEDLR